MFPSFCFPRHQRAKGLASCHTAHLGEALTDKASHGSDAIALALTAAQRTLLLLLLFRECFHRRSFQPVDCMTFAYIVGRVQSLQAAVMKLASR